MATVVVGRAPSGSPGPNRRARPTGIAAAHLRGNPFARLSDHVRRIVRKSHGTFAQFSEEEIAIEDGRLVEDLEGIQPCFAQHAAVACRSSSGATGADRRATPFWSN